jgi:hypothetical protein
MDIPKVSGKVTLRLFVSMALEVKLKERRFM